jgi:hypothetical protein
MAAAVGRPYGACFSLRGGQLVAVARPPQTDEAQAAEEAGDDNRGLRDSADHQRLTHEQIATMKRQGVAGQVRRTIQYWLPAIH